MLFTTKEISDMLRVSEETVRRWIRNGDLKATQEGKSYFIKGDDLMEAIKKKAEDSTTSIGKIVNAQLNGLTKVLASSKDELSEALRKIKEETSKHFKEQSGSSESFKSSIKSFKDDLFSKMNVIIEDVDSDASEATDTPNDDPLTKAEIDNHIEDLQLKRRRLELDYQTKLLEIDEKIAKLRKMKQTMPNITLSKKENDDE